MSKSGLPPVIAVPGLDFQLDFSGIPSGGPAEAALVKRFGAAFEAMHALERGEIANPDEQRMVGHYWLRAPELAPQRGLRKAIEETLAQIERFGEGVRGGDIGPRRGVRFRRVLHVGIGGSALGPQLAADCLGRVGDPLELEFLDNTDPDGMARVFARLGEGLRETVVVVVSKSGGTPETRNGMLEAIERLNALGARPAAHLVAITGEGSALHQRAIAEQWLATFPMWDWVGGRTSQTSAVGLVTMSLMGHDWRGLLDGARRMDVATRAADVASNPAARLAIAWHRATGGKGDRAMVVLPYRDRLLLMSRYLQQLVMESLGKELDRAGKRVEQGIAVYGNKGSTDQHAYVQQLRDGVDDFFVTFIAALHDEPGPPLQVEPGVTSGDYLLSFLLGTRRALMEKGRPCLTIAIPQVDAVALGALIALFERTVGYYAELVKINAYHQPGVEAGKKAAAAVLALQAELLAAIRKAPRARRSAADWAAAIGQPAAAIEASWLLEHLASTPGRGVKRHAGRDPLSASFSADSV